MARAKNPNLKKANTEVEFTPEQVFELKNCAQDPIYFIRTYVKIQHPTQGTVAFDLFDYQEDMVKSYKEQQYTIVLSARQTGKAVHIDTQIPTPTGWTTMGDISVGDEVLGADGKPTKVKWVSGIHIPDVAYKVHFSTGETVIACADHQWEVEWKHKKEPQVVTTQQMIDAGVTIGDKNESRFKIKTTKALQLEEAELPIDPHTLGIWLGGGHSAQGRITTHNDDLEIFEHVPFRINIRQYGYEHTKNVSTVTLYGLEEQIRRNGLQNNKHIPIQYLRASHAQRLALLQGLMDTDGYVDGMGRGQCDITLANKQLAKDVHHLVCSLGLKSTFKERLVGQFVRYEIKFSAYRDECPVFRLQRKLDKMKHSPDPSRQFSTKKRSIQKIERVDCVPMQCIGVDNTDNLFLLGESCIPTHNSTVAGAFLLWYAIFNFDKTILIASRANDHAMEMVLRIRFAYEQLPHWLKPGIQEDGWNKHNIGFDNGSRIISTATSENAGRGYSISLLYLDEFAFVSPSIQEEFWTSISPTLATGGSCIMTSTPNGDMDIFANIWRGANIPSADKNAKTGHNGFLPIRVYWDQPPGRDEKFKESQIAKIGERKWMQEYECVAGSTLVTVRDTETGEIKQMKIEDLYSIL